MRKINKKSPTMYVLAMAWLLLAFMPPAMGTVTGDLVFEREDQSQSSTFPPSIFQHWKHRIHYRCDACHDTLFKMQTGATTITMEAMKKGENCGSCHNGKLAFGVGIGYCSRCHRVPAD